MRISTLLILASMTTAIACGEEDGDTDATVGSATDNDTDMSTTASTTDTTTASTTDTTTASTTDTTTASTTDTTTASTTDTTTVSTTDGTEESSSGDSADSSSGDTVGDENCQLYCTTFMAICQDGATGLDGADPYADEAECLATCAEFEPGMEGDMAGNTLGCRGYHLGVAAVMADMGHCGHADADGSGVCA